MTTSTTTGMDLDPFVRRQLKVCECLTDADLFKGYTEESFRNLTHSALNKLPLDEESKDKISERLSELKVEARMNSQISSFLPSSIPIKIEPQVKQEVIGNEDLYALDENDEDIEFLCVKSKDQNNSQVEIAENQASNLPSNNIPNTDPGVVVPSTSTHTTTATSPEARKDESNNIGTSQELESLSSKKASKGMGSGCAQKDDQAKGKTQVDRSQECCRKRKVQGETIHDVSCPKILRLHRQSFWTDLSSFILEQPSLTKRKWNQTQFQNKALTPDSGTAISVAAVSSMTKATITSSCLKKQINIKTLFKDLNMTKDLSAFANKCGLKNSCSVELSEILNFLFSVATNLKELTFQFNALEDLNLFLDSLIRIRKNNFKKVELKSSSAAVAIKQAEIQKLAALAKDYLLGIETLVLDCGIHVEDNTDQSLNLLLHRLAGSLIEFKVTNSFIGLGSKINAFEIIVPEMQELEKLAISPKYEICTSEVQEPEIIDLEEDGIKYQETLIDIPVLVNFTGQNYSKLQSLRLGTKIDINLSLEKFRALEEFVVGSPWNLRNIFGSADVDHQYILKYIQFPDALTGPQIFQQVKAACPDLVRVKLQLPSVACLQEFFNVFGNSKLERFSLTFDYVFEAGLICPIVGRPYKLTSETDKAKMAKLKEYSDWPAFVKMNKIDVPDDNAVTQQKYFGLKNLTSLKRLNLSHHSRKLKYPDGDDRSEKVDLGLRKGFELLSFDRFPLKEEFYDELTKLVLLGVLKYIGSPHGCTAVDPKAYKEFKEKTGWVDAAVPVPKSRPNEISSALLVSRKTEVKNETADD